MDKVFLIGNAHIDPVWLWRWQEGFAEIKATFKSAADRLDEYPDFVFTSACASYYKWVEENEPALFERIRKHVKSGRWEISGGWWLQPDCNIPSGESFARHALYSQRYFKEKFGITVRVGYNVDSFGHNGMLPQILKLSGMDYYVFMRPGEHEKSLPGDLFNWVSPDGSSVLTYRIPGAYNNDLNEQKVLQRLGEVRDKAQTNDIPMMFFYGVGNHGGGPTKAVIELFNGMVGKDDTGITMSSTLDFFREAEHLSSGLPVVKEDLQHHASGCYSTMSQVKSLNRKAENRITSAESFAFAANKLMSLPYDRKSLEKAWEDVLFNQFHDIMGGCSIKEAYDDAFEVYGEALKISGDVLNSSLQKISWNIDTIQGAEPEETGKLEDEINSLLLKGFPLVVFNPNPWPVLAPIQTRDVTFVSDEDGNPVEIQPVRSSKTDKFNKWDTLFMAEMPSLGYRVFNTFRKRPPMEFKSEEYPLISEDTIENKWFRLTFDKVTGYMSSLYDKMNSIELLKAPSAIPIVIDDSGSDTWAHGIFAFRKEAGRFGNARLSVMEKGPLRAVLRVRSEYASSWITQDFTVYRNIPEIQVKTKFNWQEPKCMLKLSFTVDVIEPAAVYEIPYGAIEKAPDGNEEAGHSWFAVQGQGHGLAIANDSRYSYDVSDSEMRLTLVRSTYYADHFGDIDDYNEPIDLGVHEVNYRIIPFKGSYKDHNLSKKAAELCNPQLLIPETFHDGPLPLKASYLNCPNENIHIHAIKMCEDDSSAIIRAVETAGKNTSASFDFYLMDVSWAVDFKPYEIKTFKASETGVTETNLLEFEI
ncbi:MAG: alpha-mannosidase [Clostridia bacterium]|nr:alpha-mannosidase [Clostridia bacterium]MBN2883505.1 alpha-mannosidase [Clostridia bacterium]